MAKKVVKKASKKNNEMKIKIWKIANFTLIMVIGVLIAIASEVIGIAAVAANASVNEGFNLTVDVVKNTNLTMNKAIGITVGLYAAVQLINYVFYIFKQRALLMIAVAFELILAIITITSANYIITLLPMLSGLIYLRILRLEEE